METINDIVREMRTLGRLDEKSTDRIPRSFQALGLRTYADRIEAAGKALEADRDNWRRQALDEDARANAATYEKSSQVGNAEKMREALEAFVQLANDGVIQPRTYGEAEHHCFCALRDQVVSALAEPLRNCDVGTAEEQAKRFKTFCNAYPLMCDGCPFKDIGSTHNDCAIYWSQMPYEEVNK